MIAMLILDHFLTNICSCFFFSMAMRISYQNLLQRLVVSKTSVHCFLHEVSNYYSDHYKV